MRDPDNETKQMFTAEVLRELLDFDPVTVRFWWKVRDPKWFRDDVKKTPEHQAKVWNTRFAGRETMLSVDTDGYRVGRILDLNVKVHQIVWTLVHGSIPEMPIDHINGNKQDNRIENLRLATVRQNAMNMRLRKANRTGCHGVKFTGTAWVAKIKSNYQTIWLGTYPTFDLAAAARKGAEKALGYHQNHGRAE